MKIRTRFAPSPTGFMHIGNLRTALYAYLFAKHNDGDFILRIEDTDQERYVEGAVDVIYSTLKTAGIDHVEGPDVGGPYGPYIQSERKSIYYEYAHKLVELGGAYVCFCSKERLDSLADVNGVKKYDKHCLSLSKEEVKRRIDAGEPYVIRQNIPLTGVSEYEDMVFGKISVNCSDMEDNILLKSDGMPTYNFANVVDDHLMNINYVIRGTEYLSSTPKYNLLYDSFGWQRPNYIHLPPIMKDATRKLSKRYGDANFDDFIKKGFLSEAIVNYIALLGWSPKSNVEKMSMSELIEHFSINGVSKSSSIFDEIKMRWLNSQYIKELSIDKFNEYAEPFYKMSKIYGKYDCKKFAPLLINRIEILSEIPEKINFLDEYTEFSSDLYYNKKLKTDKEIAKPALNIAFEYLKNLNEWNIQSINDLMEKASIEKDMKKGIILWSLRVAVSGKEVTPGGSVELMDILGKEESIRRINYALTLIK